MSIMTGSTYSHFFAALWTLDGLGNFVVELLVDLVAQSIAALAALFSKFPGSQDATY